MLSAIHHQSKQHLHIFIFDSIDYNIIEVIYTGKNVEDIYIFENITEDIYTGRNITEDIYTSGNISTFTLAGISLRTFTLVGILLRTFTLVGISLGTFTLARISGPNSGWPQHTAFALCHPGMDVSCSAPEQD